MNKIDTLFQESTHKLLSLYFCAGAPEGVKVSDVLRTLDGRGVDMVEVGIPFSDPMADGPVIQDAATKALRGGMSLRKLFSELKPLAGQLRMPVILMGYLNPIMQYGFEHFFRSCTECGVSGAIIPDLPFKDYLTDIKPFADRYGVKVIMLITPETSPERIHLIDEHTSGFIYMVSSAATTGAQKEFDSTKREYFERINSMSLKNPRMIGFGISNRQTLQAAQENARGVIIGSKFVSLLDSYKDADKALTQLYEDLNH